MLDLKRKFYESKGTGIPFKVSISRNSKSLFNNSSTSQLSVHSPMINPEKVAPSYGDIVKKDTEKIYRNMQSQPPLMQNRHLRDYYSRLSAQKLEEVKEDRIFNCFTPHVTYRKFKPQKVTTFPKKWLHHKRNKQVKMEDVMPHVKHIRSRKGKPVKKYIKNYLSDYKTTKQHGTLNSFIVYLKNKQNSQSQFSLSDSNQL